MCLNDGDEMKWQLFLAKFIVTPTMNIKNFERKADEWSDFSLKLCDSLFLESKKIFNENEE